MRRGAISLQVVISLFEFLYLDAGICRSSRDYQVVACILAGCFACFAVAVAVAVVCKFGYVQ